MLEFEGIVIRTTVFRDNDLMVNVISSDKMYSFLARGAMKYQSKNAPSVNMYVKGRYQLSYGKEGKSLRNGEVIKSYEQIKGNLSSLAVLDFIGEVTNKLIINEDAKEVYQYLEKSLDLLNAGFDPLSVAILYLARVLNVIGIGLNVDSCQKCGKTSQIVGVSYSDAGFICADCFDSYNGPQVNSYKLKVIRYIFKTDLENFGKVAFEKDAVVEILKELGEFVLQNTSTKLKSLELITKL